MGGQSHSRPAKPTPSQPEPDGKPKTSASESRTEAEQKANADDSKCVDAFKTIVDHRFQKDRNSSCAPDTGLWFFHHPEFEAFRDAQGPRLLFVTAEAGGGKSTTMRTLVDKAQRPDTPLLVAYFFFKDDDDSLRSYSEALSTMLHQLLSQERSFVQHAKELYEKHGDRIKTRTDDMWGILLAIASRGDHDILCVMDAIDECAPNDRKQLVADLALAFQGGAQATSRLKFVVSSRPYQDSDHPFADLITSSNTKHLAGENAGVRSDIRNVIQFKSQELAEKQQLGPSVASLLVEKISEQNKHTRSFLAISMAFELLASDPRMRRGIDQHIVGNILADIPEKLGDQFDEMLRRSLDREHAWRLFCVILSARRTLKIPDFKVIYALTQPNRSSRAQSYDELGLSIDDEKFKQLVRSRCGLFITFVRSSVHLFHQTAREYLMTNAKASQLVSARDLQSNAERGGSWKACISKEDANLVCATVCLDIITFPVATAWVLEIFDDLNAGNHITREALKFASERPFFEYSAFNWYEHVILSGHRALSLMGDKKYAAVMDVSKVPFWVWFLPLVDYSNTNVGRPDEVTSDVWITARSDRPRDYGYFLREKTLKKLFPMGPRISTLLNDSSLAMSSPLPHLDGVHWRAENGYHYIDNFHLAFGDYAYTSFGQAVRALENGDEPRGRELSAGVPASTLIWTCISDSAPKALRTILACTTDLHWLHDVPEHLSYRRTKYSGSSTASGKALRQDRLTGWKKPWPPSFAILTELGNSPETEEVFRVLAEWIAASPHPADYAQEMWEAGSFVSSSMCRALIQAGASVESKIWKERRTALEIAAALWEHDVITALLDSGANPVTCSENGYNALHWFFHHDELFKARYRGTTISARRSSGVREERFRKSRIISSIKALAKPLADLSAVDVPTDEGETALMLAVKSSPIGTTTLLNEGAEVNKRDRRGRTALMHFFRGDFVNGRQISVLEQLLQAGADVLTPDSSGKTVLGRWARLVTGTCLSTFYPGSNYYNKTFYTLTNIGMLSQRNVLVQELAKLDVPLTLAARLGNARLCWALLDTGADPNRHGIDASSLLGYCNGSEAMDFEDLMWNPLMISLWSKAYATGAILLTYGAQIDFQIPKRKRTKSNKYHIKKSGLTPLHLAVVTNNNFWMDVSLSLCSGIYSQGCAFRAATQPDRKVSHRSRWERMAEMDAEMKRRMPKQDESSDSEYELAKSVPSNDSTGAASVPFDNLSGLGLALNKFDDPLLQSIICEQQTQPVRQKSLVKYLLQNGASVNARSQEGITPLFACVNDGLVDLTKLLLEHGADPNITASGGSTPLMKAAWRGQQDLVETLLEHGANPDTQLDVPAPGKCRCAELHSSSFPLSDCRAPITALVIAAERSHYGAVESLLAHGANMNLEIVHHVHGRLPLRRERRRFNSLRAVESSDSEEETEQWKGQISVGTALTWARGEVRDLLLRHGADPSVEKAIRACDCETIEKIQSRGGIRMISDSEEYPTSEDSDSDTPLPWRSNKYDRWRAKQRKSARDVSTSP